MRPSLAKLRTIALTGEGVRGYRLVAAAVVSKTIFYGVNSLKTHPRSWPARTCAERAALIGCARLGVDSVFVARFDRAGDAAMAKPCVRCQRLLVDLGIRKVWYTNGEGTWERLVL